MLLVPFMFIFINLLVSVYPRYPREGADRFPIRRRTEPEDFDFLAGTQPIRRAAERCALLSRMLWWKNITLQTAYVTSMVSLGGARPSCCSSPADPRIGARPIVASRGGCLPIVARLDLADDRAEHCVDLEVLGRIDRRDPGRAQPLGVGGRDDAADDERHAVRGPPRAVRPAPPRSARHASPTGSTGRRNGRPTCARSTISAGVKRMPS